MWLMLVLRWSARENGLLAMLLLVCGMPSPASSWRNALLLLLLRCLLAEWRRRTRGRQQGEARDLPARIAQPLYILLAATTYYHADLSTESERKPTLRTALHILPAHWIAPHTGLPRTHLAWKGFTPTTFSGARKGCLRRSRR